MLYPFYPPPPSSLSSGRLCRPFVNNIFPLGMYLDKNGCYLFTCWTRMLRKSCWFHMLLVVFQLLLLTDQRPLRLCDGRPIVVVGRMNSRTIRGDGTRCRRMLFRIRSTAAVFRAGRADGCNVHHKVSAIRPELKLLLTRLLLLLLQQNLVVVVSCSDCGIPLLLLLLLLPLSRWW